MARRRLPRLPRRCRAGRGFAYIALLIAVLVMGVALAAAGEVWSMAQQREKERQLLFVGGEFRRAIASYAGHADGGAPRFPRRLEELLLDPRVPGVRRHLRRIYADPITGEAQWGLLTSAGGEIYGVHSLSDAAPVKRAGFVAEDARFEGKGKYSEWVFSPVQKAPAAAPKTSPATALGRQSSRR